MSTELCGGDVSVVSLRFGISSFICIGTTTTGVKYCRCYASYGKV